MRAELKRHADAGYTLTEMLVVIVILGLIAAVVTPQIMGQMGRAREKAARVQLETVAQSVELFFADIGRYPTPSEGLTALLTEPRGADQWAGPYVRSRTQLVDPWGSPLRYEPGQEGRPFRLISSGKDRQPGGSDDIEIGSP